jgi:RNA polymerase sigma-70 factor (ECF subfamily)
MTGTEGGEYVELDLDLVATARAGDEVAFTRLIGAEIPAAYRAVLAVVGSPEDAQDVVQEAALRAWRQLGGLRDTERWPAWFRRIAVRQAFDRARQSRRRNVREVDLGSATDRTSGDPTGAWARHVIVMTALSRLSDEDRALLGLRFGADLEVPDVAEALGIPLGTAKSRLHRALGRLAKVIGEQP